jgi:hypothetical protein
MHRRRSAFWVPLLAIVFGVLGVRPPMVLPDAAALRGADLISAAEIQYTSPTRLHSVTMVRTQPIRHSGPPGDGLATRPIHESQAAGSLTSHESPVASPANGADRHFPLFPTGPPPLA